MPNYCFFSDVKIVESSDDVTILTATSEIAVCEHARYQFGFWMKQHRTTGLSLGKLRLQRIANCRDI